MRKIFVLLLLTCSLCTYGQHRSGSPRSHIITATLVMDTSVFTILPYDTSESYIFEKCKPARLSQADLQAIEDILPQCTDKYNVDEEKYYDSLKAHDTGNYIHKNNFVIDLKKYRRQYVAVVNKNGQKEVWISCFCNWYEGPWKTEIVSVYDGGNCFFQLKINLSTKKYYDLRVNGDA